MKLLKFLLPAAVLFISATPATETYTLSKDYTVTINGTSNLHSWDENVGKVSGKGEISMNEDGGFDINALNLNMEVRSIKSESSVMDNNTYKALKANADPEIVLALTAPVRAIKTGADGNTIAAPCNLTIAGVTRPVTIQVKVTMPQKDELQFEGSQTIKMTDYGVTPPVALFGMLKTGDEITIHFKTSFTITTI
jgi:polyisoprenoid-binding protein YceI